MAPIFYEPYYNDCTQESFTIPVRVRRSAYDTDGSAGAVSITVSNDQGFSQVINFSTPDIINGETSQEQTVSVTYPSDFIGKSSISLSEPTNGSELKTYIRYVEVFFSDCAYCCKILEHTSSYLSSQPYTFKYNQVIGRDLLPCECLALGGHCSSEEGSLIITHTELVKEDPLTPDICTKIGELGTCCITPICDPPCPENSLCIENVNETTCTNIQQTERDPTFGYLYLDWVAASFPHEKDWSLITTFRQDLKCNEDPCYDLAEQKQTPFPCDCAEAGKDYSTRLGDTDGCVFVYKSISDSFVVSSDCAEGCDCEEYDPDCFRGIGGGIQDGDLFTAPCCCNPPPPPPPPPCDYCCVSPKEEGFQSLDQEQCAALGGVCINSGEMISFKKNVPYEQIAKTFCTEFECDIDIGPLVRYEGSGDNSKTYSIPSSGLVSINLHAGLFHSGIYPQDNYPPVKITINATDYSGNRNRVFDLGYYGDSEYQDDLNSIIEPDEIIVNWNGGSLHHVIDFHTIGELTVNLTYPVADDYWSYQITCPYDRCFNQVSTPGSDIGAFFRRFLTGFETSKKYEEKFTSNTNNPSGVLDFERYPKLGYDTKRKFDFDYSEDIGKIRVDDTIEGTSSTFNNTALNSPIAGTKCNAGLNYFYYAGMNPEQTEHIWRLGIPTEYEYNPIDLYSSTVEDVTTRNSRAFTSNRCDWDAPCRECLTDDCYDHVYPTEWAYENPELEVDPIYYRWCSQDFLELHLNCATEEYYWFSPAGNTQDGLCDSSESYSLGALQIHRDDSEPFDIKPFPVEKLTLTQGWEIKNDDSRWSSSPCFNASCCNGSTGECRDYYTLGQCDCNFGTGYSWNESAIQSDPCSVFYTSYRDATWCVAAGNKCYDCGRIYSLCVGDF